MRRDPTPVGDYNSAFPRRSIMKPFSRHFIPAIVFCLTIPAVDWSSVADAEEIAPYRIVIDGRDLPRKLLDATLRLPIAASDQTQTVALWYPKWVPGSHGPGGPISNIAGITISDPDGNRLSWIRSPGEVYRIEVTVPPAVKEITLAVRYIANQPTTNSMGHDCFGASGIGIISPGAVLFYREGDSIDQTTIEGEVKLPKDWVMSSAISALAEANEQEAVDGSRLVTTTLRTFVDSPILCGRYRRVYELNDPADSAVVPHRLHVISDSEDAKNLNQEVVALLRSMVAQTAKLTGSQPFDSFDILLGLTDRLPANGLEHSRSTLNVLSPGAIASPGALKGWSRLLIPHEYLHAWCGKYRRPAGMVTHDFHSVKGTELLWVYEGLTQYLGELVEARAGLMSGDEFRHRVGVELRNAYHQQNRQWRPLSDTAAASHILRDGTSAWPLLRGSQDYYMEGMLFWLEVDARLRNASDGEKTLDDFCHEFFKVTDAKATAKGSEPSGYTRDEIVSILESLVAYDWDGMILRRIESPMQNYDSQLPETLGYALNPSSKPPRIPSSTFRYPQGVDEYDSIGATFSPSGVVKDILIGGAADRAKLGPGMEVIAIGDKVWSASRLREAIRQTADSRPISLLVRDEDTILPRELQYYDGAKYLTLERIEDAPDMLEQILQPR
jgi:predicted metalloprotease with PDZ domain